MLPAPAQHSVPGATAGASSRPGQGTPSEVMGKRQGLNVRGQRLVPGVGVLTAHLGRGGFCSRPLVHSLWFVDR